MKTIDEIRKIFEKYEDEYLEFDKILAKTSNRKDLHAFNLLDRLFPSNFDIVSAAAHDEIWLEVTPEQLGIATEEQILELIRCGVRYDRSTDSLGMFV